MGNTTSTHRGTYSSEDQVTIAERRRVLAAKIHPKIAARKPVQRRQLKMNISQNTSLKCYNVVLSRCAGVWHGLFIVTQPLRCAGQEEKSELPRMKPRFIFHIRGNFGNPSHNSLISVVFVTKGYYGWFRGAFLGSEGFCPPLRTRRPGPGLRIVSPRAGA